MTDLTWIDFVMVAVVASLTALGATRKLIGLFVGVGGMLLLRPLLGLGQGNPWLAIAVAFVCGLVLALVGRRLVAPGKGPEWAWKVAGGFGGAILGVAMVLALVTALPIQRNPANEREIFYPPRDVGTQLAVTLQRSSLVMLGRTILLYPLLPEADRSPREARVLSGLHGWLVVGEPWMGR